MIQVEELSKAYAGQILFDQVGFKINAKERIGLVGRNGHGKTTLFKMILGQEQPDDGRIMIPKGYRIGYVEQHIAFTQDAVLAEAMRGLPASESDHHWKAEKILDGLGFGGLDMDRHPGELSGGFQVRLNLAKALLSEPDLLLLDEPTNYLDITSIRWVERFLAQWPRELLLITHDRGFMDKVITHTLAVHRCKIRKIEGDTGKLYAQIAQDEEIHEKTRLNDERRRKEIEQFISRFRAKARLANLVQSRIKTLAKMEKKDRLDSIKTLEFSFRDHPFPGKFVLDMKDLAFGYEPSKLLFRDLSIAVKPGDRICVVGQNGRGKTSLLKVIAGDLDPLRGNITWHPAVRRGFFEQTNVNRLVDSRTVEEEILYAHEDMDRQRARNICGAMMFEQDNALKKIGVLSGGEKSRVLMGKLLATPLNLLLLDEPTNHLDMDSCDALLAALDAFQGTVIMVTHNEMFLHTLAERLIVFTDQGAGVFEGTYQRFLEKGGWHDDQPAGMSPTSRQPDDAAQQRKVSKKDLRRQRSEAVAARSKILKPLEKKIDATETTIESLEAELNRLHEEMQSASEACDGKAISRIAQGIHEHESDLEALYARLESLYIEKEGQEKSFENPSVLQDNGK